VEKETFSNKVVVTILILDKEQKGEIYKYTVIVGDINIPQYLVEDRQKISKDTD
jgi:hypothetical protein